MGAMVVTHLYLNSFHSGHALTILVADLVFQPLTEHILGFMFPFQAQMPKAGPSTQILLCGPPPMINFACLPNLEKLGFSQDNILTF
jgi:hypothetical protein